jgi:hypothetical protein
MKTDPFGMTNKPAFVIPEGSVFFVSFFARLRNVDTAAPAMPTSASTTVGFSGELTQPPWAWASAGVRARRAKRRAIFIVLTPRGTAING